MRKIRLIVLTGILVGLSSAVFACGNEGGMMQGSMGMMHSGMKGASMVSSNDGGVIVMIGNKLYKYDKNLNLVKEVELKMDMPQMKMMDNKSMPMMDNKGIPGAQMMEKKGCSCSMGSCGAQASGQIMQQQQPQADKAASGHESHH